MPSFRMKGILIWFLYLSLEVNSIELHYFNGEEKHPHSFNAVQQAALKIYLR